MTTPRTGSDEEFDAFADRYEESLEQGLRLSGEDSGYFAEARVAWTGQRLAALGLRPRTVLDFGCGTGSTTPYLLGLPDAERVIGSDSSLRSLEIARRDHASDRATFVAMGDLPEAEIDLAYCNGVFHHIPVVERAGAIECIRRSLRPGGLFAFWENNPWNPGTRMVMRRIPFDRDAVMVSSPEARRLLATGGLEVVRTDFQFIFPRALRFLRGLERRLAGAPIGAQYLVLARRPERPVATG